MQTYAGRGREHRGRRILCGANRLLVVPVVLAAGCGGNSSTPSLHPGQASSSTVSVQLDPGGPQTRVSAVEAGQLATGSTAAPALSIAGPLSVAPGVPFAFSVTTAGPVDSITVSVQSGASIRAVRSAASRQTGAVTYTLTFVLPGSTPLNTVEQLQIQTQTGTAVSMVATLTLHVENGGF